MFKNKKYTIIIFIVVTLVIIFAVFGIQEITRRKKCVNALTQYYHMTDYSYDVDKLEVRKENNIKINVYNVTIYNDAWYIEVVMSIDESNEVTLEKVITIK